MTYIKLGVFITYLLGNNRLNYGNVIKHLTFYQMTDKGNNFYKNGKNNYLQNKVAKNLDFVGRVH